MAQKGKGGGSRNDNRANGKASKKHPKSNRKTGKTVGGYSAAKLAIRAEKRTPERIAKVREIAQKVVEENKEILERLAN